MRAFERYEHYKSSSIKWIGDIPSHWEAKKLKFSTLINNKTLTDKTDKDYVIQYVDIGNVDKNGLAGEPEKLRFEDAPSRARRIVSDGDTIISTVRTYLKALAYFERADDNLIASTGFAVLTSGEKCFEKFLYYFVSSDYFIQQVSYRAIGIMYPSIGLYDIGSIKLLLPPLEEQKQIADFLDSKSTQIDEFIADKQALIALFEEQKSAVINEAVTKGLNKTAQLKPSGVEWLGNIPSHWEAKKLKYSMQIKSGIGITANDLKDDGSFKVYGGNGCIGFYDAFNTVDEVLIIGRVGAKCGNVHFVNEKIWVSDNALIVETSENYAFMYYLLSSLNLNKLSTSTAQPLITGSDIKNYTVALPPLEEQKQIVDYLEKELSTIDTLIETAKAEITLIEEYKTSLINEVVTGKIKI